MDVVELLKMRGLDTTKRIKFVRHQDQRYDVYELMTRGLLETYQACQSRPVLNCDYMVSFIGLPRGHARLYGVYRVLSRTYVSEVEPLDEYLANEDPKNYFYRLHKEAGFEDLEERGVRVEGQVLRFAFARVDSLQSSIVPAWPTHSINWLPNCRIR